MKIAITTDSSSGILINEAKEQGIFVLPMPFLIDGECYFEGINLSQDDFYKKLNENAEVSTSQPSVGELTDFWTALLQEYERIVHIPISSSLSQSYSAATNLANTEEFAGKVTVVDNRRISVTLKQSVYNAAKLRDQGNTPEEIKTFLESNASNSSIYIAVDTMKYLKKGGRVSPAAATIGSILKIKPVLQIHGGKLDKFALARGSLKAKETMKTAIKNDIETRFGTLIENGEFALFVAHTNCQDEAKKFGKELQTLFPNIPVTYCDALSLVVSCHIGAGALAVACARIVK